MWCHVIWKVCTGVSEEPGTWFCSNHQSLQIELPSSQFVFIYVCNVQKFVLKTVNAVISVCNSRRLRLWCQCYNSVVYFFNFIFLLDSWRKSILLVLPVLWQHFLSVAVGIISDMSRQLQVHEVLHKIYISGKNVAYLIHTAGSKCGSCVWCMTYSGYILPQCCLKMDLHDMSYRKLRSIAYWTRCNLSAVWPT